MDNIYINSLRTGFYNSSKGISFDEVVAELNIDLSDISFKLNYTTWFYSNFYHPNVEKYVIGSQNNPTSSYRIKIDTIDIISKNNNTKSYIKGDAVNKYIDFLELDRTRKSSRMAFWLSIASIIIAITSVVIPIIFIHNPKPPYEVIITNDRNNTTNGKFDNSLDCKSGITDTNNYETSSTDTLDVINLK